MKAKTEHTRLIYLTKTSSLTVAHLKPHCNICEEDSDV